MRSGFTLIGIAAFFICAVFIFCLSDLAYASTKKSSELTHNLLELPITTEVVSKFYQKADGVFEFYLLPEYAAQTVNFIERQTSVRVQGGLIHKVRTDWKYYEIGRFYADDFLYTLIIYNYPGEFDDPYLAVQLNAYAADGRQLDAVVLDTRYRFEDVEVFSEYQVENGQVTVRSYVGYYWDADDIDAGMVLEPPHQLYSEKQYRIDKGHFVLEKEEKHPVVFINKNRND